MSVGRSWCRIDSMHVLIPSLPLVRLLSFHPSTMSNATTPVSFEWDPHTVDQKVLVYRFSSMQWSLVLQSRVSSYHTDFMWSLLKFQHRLAPQCCRLRILIACGISTAFHLSVHITPSLLDWPNYLESCRTPSSDFIQYLERKLF